VKVAIRDAGGAVVREFAGEATKGKGEAGLNVVQWDLRVAPLPPLRGQPAAGSGGFFGGGLNGPHVLPGTYQAALQVDGKEVATAHVSVAGDPDIAISDADRKARFDAAMALHALQRTANDGAEALGALGDQLTPVKEKVRTVAVVPDAVRKALEDLDKQLTALRPRLGLGGAPGGGFAGFQRNVRGRIGQVKGAIMNSTSLPTEVQTRQMGELEAELAKVIGELNQALGAAAALFRELAEKGIYPATPAPVK